MGWEGREDKGEEIDWEGKEDRWERNRRRGRV